MTAGNCHTQPKSEWFAEPPSRLLTSALWATAKIAAGVQNVCGDCCSDGFAILMYHRVAEHVSGVEAPTCNVTPELLRHQLTGLLARGFVAWPLKALIKAKHESRAIPPNVFAVTFDDGYENNYLHAWPILRKLNVPATIFVATKYLDTERPFPFDDWSAAGSSRVTASAWRPLSTNQCKELLTDGLIELGAHTHSHERFRNRCDEFRRDMRLCLEVLRDRFAIDKPTFAFPYGELTPELTDASKQLDLACCLSTRHRRVLPGDSVFQWGRFDVKTTDSPAVLAAKLSGWYTAIAAAGKKLTSPMAKLGLLARRRSHGPLHEVRHEYVPSEQKALSQP